VQHRALVVESSEQDLAAVRSALDQVPNLSACRVVTDLDPRSCWRDAALFDAARDAIIVHDPVTGRIEQTNPAASALFGYTAREFRSVRATDLLDSVEPANDQPDTASIPPGDVVMRTRSGERIIADVSSSVLEADGGTHTLSIIRDRTATAAGLDNRRISTQWLDDLIEDKTAQLREKHDALARINDNLITTSLQLEDAKQELEGRSRLLEALVEERTTELAAAIGRAEEASRFKNDFLASMSHEIRTPMNSILGFAEILLGEPLPDVYRRHVSTIHRNAVALLELINDVLDLSKVEAGRMDIFKKDFCLEELVQSVASMLEVSAKDRHTQITLDIDPALPRWIESDEQKLRQVLVNLVGNAVKFTTEGQVTIAARPHDEQLEIRVIDDGIGIPAAKRETIFEPFAQVGGPTRQGAAGTGLGLTIVKRFVELMGGRITCRSVEGEGSTFTVTVPFRAGEEPEFEPAPLSPPDLSAMNIGEPRLVLIAEDNPDNQIYIKALLEAQNFKVIFADNGDEAVHKAALKPDLILMDIQMPLKNGYEATAEIKRNSGLAAIPIVALTAYAMPKERQRAFAAGVDGYVSKPLSRDRLLGEIGRVLDADIEAAGPEPVAGPPAPGADEIVRQYVATFGRKLADFERMVGASDLEGLRYFGHGLKGSGATYGFQELSEVGEKIEEAAETADTTGVATLGGQLEQVLTAAAVSIGEPAP